MSEWPRHLDELDWDEISIRLAAYVSYRLGRRGIPADVEELVAETLCRVLDGEYKNWDPDAEPNPLRFCISVANGLMRNFVRSHRRRNEIAATPALPFAESDEAGPDRGVVARDRARAMSRLRARISGDELVEKVLDAHADGFEKTRHIADVLGVTRPEVRNAKRRLLGHIEAVRDEISREEARDADR
jgi:DNA-directed RNA polymerase specialized sigma24 family protein